MRLAAAALALLLLAGSAAALRGGDGNAAPTVSELEFRVRTASGRVIWLHFIVDAPGPAEAREAAAATLARLMPGASVLGLAPGDAEAQWKLWTWTWDASEFPVTMTYNPAGAAPGLAPDTLAAALQTWTSEPGSSLTFAYGGFTNRPGSLYDGYLDGENVIAWGPLDCRVGCVLGITSKDDEAHEADVILNNDPRAGLGDGASGNIDVRTTLLHELGHVAGLAHSCTGARACAPAESEAVMYYRYAGMRRNLRADDIQGISTLYPAVTPTPTPTGTPVPVAITVSLLRGWNLAVLPTGLLFEVAAQLPCAEAVYGGTPEGWSVWVRGVSPALQGLVSTSEEAAYFVFASSACRATFAP